MTRLQSHLLSLSLVTLTGVACTGIYAYGDQPTRDSLAFLGLVVLLGLGFVFVDQAGRVIDRRDRHLEQRRHALASGAASRLPHEPRSRASRGSPEGEQPAGASETEGDLRDR